MAGNALGGTTVAWEPTRAGRGAIPCFVRKAVDQLALLPRHGGRFRKPFREARVDGLQLWQHLKAKPIARIHGLPVGDVLAIGDSPRAAVRPHLVRVQAEQRTDELAVERRHAGQGRGRGILGEPVQHGLCLVVPVVGRGGARVAVLCRQDAGGVVAKFPRPLLEVGAAQAGRSLDHVELHTVRGTRLLDDPAVSPGVRAPQTVVHMQGGGCDTEGQLTVAQKEQLQHCHGVGPAGEHQ